VIDEKEPAILALEPETVTGDNSYTQATRIRTWAKRGVVLLTPALKWRCGRYAAGYHRFIKQPDNTELLAARRITVEPLFDLISKVLGTTDNQKQLPVKGRANVRTFLVLGVLTVQIAMIVNNLWGLPLHNISHMASVFT
jgi:hypothetical protein